MKMFLRIMSNSGIKTTVVCLQIFLFQSTGWAAPGELDPTFDTDGIVITELQGGGTFTETAEAVAVQPDGKILVAGLTDNDFAILHYDGFTLDVTPDAYTFTDVTGVDQGQPQTSNIVTVGGLDLGVSMPVSVADGEYTLDGGTTYTSGINWVTNGDQVNLQHTSAAAEGATVSTTLSIGGVMAPNGIVHLGTAETASDIFESTTEDDDDGGSGGSSIDWMFMFALGVIVLFRRHREIRVSSV